MAKKKTPKPQKTCGDCIHEHACAMWNIGTIHEMNATNCTNHETARESAAYLIGKMEAQQWIPVSERLPEEHDSMFAKWYGTPTVATRNVPHYFR